MHNLLELLNNREEPKWITRALLTALICLFGWCKAAKVGNLFAIIKFKLSRGVGRGVSRGSGNPLKYQWQNRMLSAAKNRLILIVYTVYTNLQYNPMPYNHHEPVSPKQLYQLSACWALFRIIQCSHVLTCIMKWKLPGQLTLDSILLRKQRYWLC